MLLKATLIQDVTHYRYSLEPWLGDLMSHYAYLGCVAEDALEWAIARQIEECYSVAIANHSRNRLNYAEFHDRLSHALPFPLGQLTRQLIKVPDIYGDQTLTLRLRHRDLYLHYYLDTSPDIHNHELPSRVPDHPHAGN